jgi:hypothetical protein
MIDTESVERKARREPTLNIFDDDSSKKKFVWLGWLIAWDVEGKSNDIQPKETCRVVRGTVRVPRICSLLEISGAFEVI